MRILVTGANGFLGTNLISFLLKKSIEIIGLVRDPGKLMIPTQIGLTIVKGDLLKDNLAKILPPDIHAIIHTAALTDQSYPRYKTYYQTNVKATQNLIEWAVKSKVKHFVFVSSASVNAYLSGKDLSYYAKSKWQAEKVLTNYAEDIKLSIIRPSFILGSLSDYQASNPIINWADGKKIIFYPPGGKNFICVQDVVRHLFQVLSLPKELLIIGSWNLTYKAFFQEFIELSKQKSKLIKIPKSICYVLGTIGEFLRLFKIKTPLSLSHIKAITSYHYLSSNQKNKNTTIMSSISFKKCLRNSIPK